MNRRHSHRLTIAGVRLGLSLPDHCAPGANYQNYLDPGETGSRTDIVLHGSIGAPCFHAEKLPFHRVETIQTSFLARPGTFLFKRKREAFLVRKNFSRSRFWCSSPDYMTASKPYLGSCGWPLLAVWGKLSISGGGILLHGALVHIRNRFILLTGPSGVGKTTLSHLMVDEEALCLTDENPFVRCCNRTAYAYGSPWYSDESLDPGSSEHLSTSGQLSAILILHHASENNLSRLDPQNGALALINNTRMFNWLPETIPHALDHIDRMVSSVPVYRFGFTPDTTAVHAVIEEIDRL